MRVFLHGGNLEREEETLGSIETFPGVIIIKDNKESTSKVIKMIED